MVTVLYVGETAAIEGSTLQRILKRANYATSDMQADEGPERHEEVVIIRRIEAGTIPSQSYPPSLRRRQSSDPDALASWENEGGATSARSAAASKAAENRR
ncbi:hypothetical protein [Rhizobium mongolense]|uniref:Uncharacterized protein n=1 Tax=Rhizobium mongolense TaxID=57676 RepID=A0A7W6WG13_9HYPH|nr:hypothetical protein [Rhizobium mongolense]MBB4276259.1 hypothetical protein [Rhizobium mongolense]